MRRIPRCQTCAHRHTLCETGSSPAGPCASCQRLGIECLTVDRVANDSALIQGELRRLEKVLQRLESQKGRLTSDSDGAFELDDLIGSMTLLCFEGNGIGGPANHVKDENLFEAAQAALAEPEALSAMPPGGFVFTSGSASVYAASANLSLQQIIASLPAYAALERLLEIYTTQLRVPFCEGCLFWPDFPGQLAEIYREGALAEQGCHFVAQLCALVAVILRSSPSAMHNSKDGRTAETYAAMAQRALELGDYVEQPTTESLRAFYLLITFHILWAEATHALHRGLALLPLAISALVRMDYHRSEDFWTGRQTPKQRYERQVLATGLLRLDWTVSPVVGRPALSYGRKVFLDVEQCEVEPPADSCFDTLQPEMVQSGWLPSRIAMRAAIIMGYYTSLIVHRQGLRARFSIARLQQRIFQGHLVGKKVYRYKAIRETAQELSMLEKDMLPAHLGVDDSVEDGACQWRTPASDLSPEERLIRSMVQSMHSKVGRTLHRRFISYTPTVSPSERIWHQQELLRYSVRQLHVLEACRHTGHGTNLLGVTYLDWDALISVCTLLTLSSKYTMARRRVCDMVELICSKSPAAPVGKLSQLARHLLENDGTSVREDECEPPQKRSKRQSGFLASGDHVKMIHSGSDSETTRSELGADSPLETSLTRLPHLDDPLYLRDPMADLFGSVHAVSEVWYSDTLALHSLDPLFDKTALHSAFETDFLAGLDDLLGSKS